MLVEEREEERLAVAEAAKEGRLADAGLVRDLLEADAGDAALREKAPCGFEDPRAIAGGVGPLGSLHGS